MTAAPRFAAKTHPGLVRPVNEDSVVALPEKGVWVVADGMGGHEAGDVASAIVTESVAMIDADLTPADTVRALRGALQYAHERIQHESAMRHGQTMGSTVVALAIANGHFACLWSGDSRLYRLQNGGLEMLTTDHSVVAALVAARQLTWDEAEHHPSANQITNAVGVGQRVDLDKIRGEIHHGDRFLLCTDGLSKYAPQHVLEHILTTSPMESVANRLMDLALEGGGADNISLIVIDID